MKITDVRAILLSCDYPSDDRPVFPGGVGLRKHVALVQLATDAGLTGLGEIGDGAFFPEAVPIFVERLSPLLMGQDPTRIRSLCEKMFRASTYWGQRGLAVGVISGLEVALWDLLGQATGQPVYDLLGGLYYDRLRLYAGGVAKPLDQLTDQLRGFVAEGYTAVKVRIGQAFPGADGSRRETSRSIAPDIEVVRVARAAIGADVDLLVDAGQSQAPSPWSVGTAIRVARELQEYDVFWLEDPYRTDDLDGLAAVAAAVDVPIAVGEATATLTDFAALIERRAADILQPDVIHAGGLNECKRIATLAGVRGVPIAPHCWWSGVGLMATLHFIASTPGCIITEFSRAPFTLREALLLAPLEVEDGYLRMPRTPGLGVHLPPGIEEQYPFRPGPTWKPVPAW
ncbi:MAG: mandelate racemase/muconate lactonizing enzyme family protein [Ardenticatenaceae bacterium]|nr:mandelate racemase/muconate lactonizing enzyme family protein [Ardenticatenaceae bacterium]HBY96663.1 mandelate racemase/muconate lactonizing enzyme family protein [Chloroflexota bacterium]